MGTLFLKAKNLKNLTKKYSLHITGAACVGNFLVGTGKLVMLCREKKLQKNEEEGI